MLAAQQPLAERLGAIADDLAALAKPGGRDMTKDEVDAMWVIPDVHRHLGCCRHSLERTRCDSNLPTASKPGSALTSALVILESAMRLSTKLGIDPVVVKQRIQAFLEEARITLAPMDGATASLAVKAFADYGKGRGHPAPTQSGRLPVLCLCKGARCSAPLQRKRFFTHGLGLIVVFSSVLTRPQACRKTENSGHSRFTATECTVLGGRHAIRVIVF